MKSIKVNFLKLFLSLLVITPFLCFNSLIKAQSLDDIDIDTDLEINELLDNDETSEESVATEESKLSSPSAEIEEKLEEKSTQDITDPNPIGKKSELAAHLDENPIGKLTWNNILQKSIRKSIRNGIPANIIVLLLLFPVITAIIAISRHVIGLKGFGIYIPAVLSVAFVSTDIMPGIIIFTVVLISSYFSHKVLKKMQLQYLPRTSMMLWFVSTIILCLLMIASLFDKMSFLTINIFPILIIMLLTENFMSSQLFNSQKQALRLTLETLIIAIICAFIISRVSIQKFVILNPELTLFGVIGINLLIGKYKGLRLLEYFRFDSILKRDS